MGFQVLVSLMGFQFLVSLMGFQTIQSLFAKFSHRPLFLYPVTFEEE